MHIYFHVVYTHAYTRICIAVEVPWMSGSAIGGVRLISVRLC